MHIAFVETRGSEGSYGGASWLRKSGVSSSELGVEEMGGALCRRLVCDPNSGTTGAMTSQEMAVAQVERVRAKLAPYGQEHVLAFETDLSDENRAALLEQLEGVDLDEIEAEMERDVKADSDKISPFPAADIVDFRTASTETKAKWRKRGLQAVAASHVGIVLVAGGQGTRLGYNHPKGMYNIGLPSQKSLFQLQAEKIQSLRALAAREVGVRLSDISIPWYVMTSNATHEETVDFLVEGKGSEARRGGLPKADIRCFKQGMMACVTKDGKLILSAKGELAMAPNGNGGLYKALADNGVLDDMLRRGVRYIHAYCVDNALSKLAEPHFMGYCIESKTDAANKVLPKRSPHERVGVMCLRNGRPSVCEYSEISRENAELRGSDGGLVYGAANICSHYFTTAFLVRFSRSKFALPFHRAHKAIPLVDEKGETYAPKDKDGNKVKTGIKLEKFIFDIFHFADSVKSFMVPRFGEFSPVKNKPGQGRLDAPDIARADVNRYHTSLLEKAGIPVKLGITEARVLTVDESKFSSAPSLLQDFQEAVGDGAPKFVFVVGAPDAPSGKSSWCPDCVVAIELLEKLLKRQGRVYQQLVLTVGREGYKGNKQHMYRTHPQLEIKGVPTLFLWTGEGPIANLTLGEQECQNEARLSKFLDMAWALNAPNIEIAPEVSYDGEGLDAAREALKKSSKDIAPPTEVTKSFLGV